MPLKIPAIDDRDYREILQEALARIRVHNPEWTNFHPSDPGITILELFSFMTESLLYRSNLIPERNRYKFLSLLGIPLRPASAARGLVTFSIHSAPARSLTVPAGLQVWGGQVPFRTLDGLEILPIEIRVCYKRKLSTQRSEEIKARYGEIYGSEVDLTHDPLDGALALRTPEPAAG